MLKNSNMKNLDGLFIGKIKKVLSGGNLAQDASEISYGTCEEICCYNCIKYFDCTLIRQYKDRQM